MRAFLITSTRQTTVSALAKIIRLLIIDFEIRVVIENDNIFDQIQNADEPLIYVGDSDSLQDWLWNKIRCQPNVYNPVIVLGKESTDTFLRLNPVFREGKDNLEHIYISPPWKFIDIIGGTRRAKPIAHMAKKLMTKEWTRIEIFGHFAFYNRLERLFGHDIPQGAITKSEWPLEEALSIAQKRDDEWLIQKVNLCKEYLQKNQIDLMLKIIREVHNKLTAINVLKK